MTSLSADAVNLSLGSRIEFTETGPRAVPLGGNTASWVWRITPVAHDHGAGGQQGVGPRIGANRGAMSRPGFPIERPGPARLSFTRGAIEYDYGSMTASYVSREDGLDQTLVLRGGTGHSPSQVQARLDVQAAAGMSVRLSYEEDGIELVDRSGVVLFKFGDLRARDALGRDVSAHLKVASVPDVESGAGVEPAADGEAGKDIEEASTNDGAEGREGSVGIGAAEASEYLRDGESGADAADAAPGDSRGPLARGGGESVDVEAGKDVPSAAGETAPVTDPANAGVPSRAAVWVVLDTELAAWPIAIEMKLVRPQSKPGLETSAVVTTAKGSTFAKATDATGTTDADPTMALNAMTIGAATTVTTAGPATTAITAAKATTTARTPTAAEQTGTESTKFDSVGSAVSVRATIPAVATFAPPSNDNCAGAIAIPNGSQTVLTTPVDVIDATATGDPALCITTDRTIWYTFSAPVTGTYVFTTCSSAGANATTLPDTVLAIYNATAGCAAPGPGVGCNDDDPSCSMGHQASLIVNLVAGTPYFVIAGRVAGPGVPDPTPGQTTIQIRVTQPPTNDSCGSAVPALALNTPVSFSTVAASDDYELSSVFPTCFTLPGPPLPVGQTSTSAAGRDVVYSFTAPAADKYSFRITGYNTSQNPVLYVADSCPAGPSPVTLNNPPCLGAANRSTPPAGSGTAEEVTCVTVAAGQRVYVFVDDAVAGNVGSSFKLEVNRCARENEPNNTPAAANALACPIEGSMNPANNFDYYSLGTPVAGSRVFAMSDGVAGNSTDHVMRITTSVDTLEWDDDDNFTPYGTLSPNIAGRPLTGAAAFVQIGPLATSPVAQEPYRLYAVLQPPMGSSTAETEPNDTTVSANASGTNYFSGTLAGAAPSTDLDLFRFTARAGSLIMLNLDADPLRDSTPINPKLDLLDSGGSLLIQVNDNKGVSSTTSGAGSLTAVTPNSPGEALTWRAEATGTYYARVSIGTASTTNIGAGDYLLSISSDCLAGDLDSDGVPDQVDCAPADPSTWAIPTVSRSLVLTGSGPTALTWSSPESPGTNAVLRYDVLRSTSRSDFSSASAICLESDDTNTAATDSSPRPAPGTGYFYLVRAENSCGGNMGASSSGVPHTGRNCP